MTCWTANEKRLWRDLIQHLDDECPVRLDTRVIRRSPGGEDESKTIVYCGDPLCYILIMPSLPYHSAVMALLHEWAHAMADDYNARDDIETHTDLWGIAYATIYRAFLHWLRDN